MSELLVSMEGIDRSFPGVRALDRCRFELRPGEVHADEAEHARNGGRCRKHGRRAREPAARADVLVLLW